MPRKASLPLPHLHSITSCFSRIRNSTDDVNEVANVATPKPARPVEEQFSKLNAQPDDDGPTRALSGAVPCKPSTAALPPQVVKQNSAGVADPATNKLNNRQESLAVIKYVPAPAYSSLFTARNAKEADRFRENGGDVASITVSCLTILFAST